MPVETAAFNGTSSLTWTSTARYVLGARGIDGLQTETSGGTVSTYPLNDTHGNVKAYVKKETSNTWSSLGWKQYNVWGGVRSSSGGAGTTSAYCGNLGHVADLETGLIYMRARYYAPWAGRFVSQDPAMDGINYYTYCKGNPVANVDASGGYSEGAGLAFSIGTLFAMISWAAVTGSQYALALNMAQTSALMFALAFAVEEHFGSGMPASMRFGVTGAGLLFNGGGVVAKTLIKFSKMPAWTNGMLGAAIANANAGKFTLANQACFAFFAYTLVLVGALLAMEMMD